MTAKDMQVEKQAYTAKEAARILGVGMTYVRKQIKLGNWPTLPMEGNIVRIPKWFIDQKLEATKEG